MAGGAKAVSALWTFPSILLSAFLVAWGAEAAQFLISQGLALALLAWLQTLPEFAVEAVIAWDAGRDPERAHLAVANLTGAIRLLLGLGWPMIYFVIIVLKGSMSWIDALALFALYFAYLYAQFRNPPRDTEQLSEAPRISQWAVRQSPVRRTVAIGALFGGGGVLLYATAHPFLESILALAATFGVSQFVLVQWVAPFLSEFPEKLSAFYWARRVTHAPMALMNMVSSNINQWTVLAAMIPLVYGYSHLQHHGTWADFPFDHAQRVEIVLTLLQTGLGMLLLANMQFDWLDATALFVLWAVQFFVPHLREEIAVTYAVWMLVLIIGFVVRGKRLLAPRYFWEIMRRGRGPEAPA